MGTEGVVLRPESVSGDRGHVFGDVEGRAATDTGDGFDAIPSGEGNGGVDLGRARLARELVPQRHLAAGLGEGRPDALGDSGGGEETVDHQEDTPRRARQPGDVGAQLIDPAGTDGDLRDR